MNCCFNSVFKVIVLLNVPSLHRFHSDFNKNVLDFTALDKYEMHITSLRPPLWSSGQTSWLQIRKPGSDSQHYQKKKVVGLKRGPLSLVSITEELLDRKVAAPV
jgi:hypothetical protein